MATISDSELLKSIRWISANARELEHVCAGTDIQRRIELECLALSTRLLEAFPKQENFGDDREEYILQLANACGVRAYYSDGFYGGVKVPRDKVGEVLAVLKLYGQEHGQLMSDGFEALGDGDDVERQDGETGSLQEVTSQMYDEWIEEEGKIPESFQYFELI